LASFTISRFSSFLLGKKKNKKNQVPKIFFNSSLETQPSTDFQKSIAFHFGIPFEKISFFYSSIFPQLFEVFFSFFSLN